MEAFLLSCLGAAACFNFPDACGLVTRCGQDLGTLRVEANLADFPFVAY